MGHLQNCIDAGIPAHLIVSVAPGDRSVLHKGVLNPKLAGKCPARYDRNRGEWYATGRWHLGGISPRLIKEADEDGANAGVILGLEAEGYKFISIDFDGLSHILPNGVDRGEVIVREFVARLVEACHGGDLLIRKTVPYRRLVLVRLPADADPGHKAVINLRLKNPKSPDDADLGKIEILTHGNQSVIAGLHPSGNQMTWYRPANEKQLRNAPPVKVGMLQLPNFETVLHNVLAAARSIMPSKIEVDDPEVHKGQTERKKDIKEHAAPSVDDLVTLLDSMPNPPDLERDPWLSVGFASAAAIKGLDAKDPNIVTADDIDRVKDAFVEWAMRWDGNNDDAETHAGKWEGDFYSQSDYSLGWTYMVKIAGVLGADSPEYRRIRNEHLTNDFSDILEDALEEQTDEEKFSTSAISASNDPDSDQPEIDRKTDRAGLTIPVADIQVADDIEKDLGAQARWIVEDQKWTTWYPRQGWSSESNDARVRLWIAERLWLYSEKRQMDIPANKMEHMLSLRKTNNIELMLRDRLAIRRRNMDQGAYILQTPRGAYDLRTGDIIPNAQQLPLYDTRRTAVAPRPGPTPMFDELTFHLADEVQEVHDYLLSYLGYCLVGVPQEQVFLVIWGPNGNNGKSVLMSVMRHLLGSYAGSLDPKVLLETGAQMHRTSLMELRGKRLVTISEPQSSSPWNEELIKAITGRDEIEANRMRQDPSKFRFEGGLLISCNRPPPFHNAGNAILRRLRMMSTNWQPERIDGELERKIIELEGPAVLHKCMQKAMDVLSVGNKLPPTPPVMTAVALGFAAENDPFIAWVRSECDVTKTRQEECLDDLLMSYALFKRRREAEMNDEPEDTREVPETMPPHEFLKRFRNWGVMGTDATGNTLRRMTAAGKKRFVRGVKLKNPVPGGSQRVWEEVA